MDPPNKLPQRKPSILGMHNKYRSAQRTPPDSIYPSTSTSSQPYNSRPQRRRLGLRSFFSKSHEPEAQSPVLTSPSSSLAMPSSLPLIPKFTKAFVNALNSSQLCDFLTWLLYHDIVELPEVPEAWYKWISNVEMRGWIALGNFLAVLQEKGAAHEFDLIVLDSICDRIGLTRSTVHALLIRFADPEKMKYSSLVLDEGMFQDDDARLRLLETTQSKLHELYKLAVHLKPQQGLQYEEWLKVIQKRLRAFSLQVVDPCVAHLRTGKPLTTVATSEQLPKDVIEGIKMKCLYEAMQQERVVPLERYRIRSAQTDIAISIPLSSLPCVDDEVERARSHAIELMVENRGLRSQIAVLQQDKERLAKANEKLAQRFAKLGHLQPTGYVRSFSCDEPYGDVSEDREGNEDQSMTLQVLPPSSRRRSVSTGDIEAFATVLGQGFSISTNHRRDSEIEAQKYEDMFSSSPSSPLPTVRLSALATPTPSSSIAGLRAARPLTSGYAPMSGRRSGMIFDRKNMVHLAGTGVKEGTPTLKGSDTDDNEGRTGEYASLTPMPESRKIFDLSD